MSPTTPSSTFKDVLVVGTVSCITMLNMFLSGALTVAIPTIGQDLHFKEGDLQWPVTVFSLAYGCALLFFGRIGDIVGGRTMFLVGSVWFAAWSLGAAFAPNPTALIVFVAMLGLGAAANTPAGIGIFVGYFPQGPRRNNAFGVLGAGQPVGYILGLVLGGVIAQSPITWRGIFYVQTAFAAFFVILGLLVLDKDDSTSDERRYKKGLDWGGAIMSIAGIGLLTYSLAATAEAPKGWATPYLIVLICISVVILVIFWFYEQWRERRAMAVLMPPSIWSQPGAKMPAVIGMIFFAWWSFNTMLYISTLYYQQVKLLPPLQTSIRFLPTIICAIGTNLAGGWLMNFVLGLPLILMAVTANILAALLFALIDVQASYWRMSFWVMSLLAGADLVYPIGTLQVSAAFSEDSKSLAGGVFIVATRLGTSIGVAVTSSIATAVSKKYNESHPGIPHESPEVVMVGLRAAGWTLCGAAVISFIIALIGLRGIGIVGQKPQVFGSQRLSDGDTEQIGSQSEEESRAPEDATVTAAVAPI
ncbi:major facilitator superfamily-domain-containing protein [Roridomyces roridus]|uniref:Major facilitator superfamily-domain-containing protein n=1 Tax=Roridomyces roridus TaxID=1738132 RepID=A0AAD7B6D1_9AGAR|nr:major facilitator superfamily-domain-containing protein [Roridomyces roridus]